MKKILLFRLTLSAIFLFGITTAIAASAQTFSTLASFDGTGGAAPVGLPVQATDGSIFGITIYGGNTGQCGNIGCGTVFKVTPSGALISLYSFCVQFPCLDGSGPVGIIQATDGNFYGASGGGANGYGTVFKITPNGLHTTLYSFCAQTGCPDGDDPFATVAQGTDGNLYGTTNYGGLNNYGTVFRVSLNGTFTTLHSFESTDGAYPQATLLQASDGNFYGGTSEGGDFTCTVSKLGCGTLFKITPDGTLTTFYAFHGSDGAYPAFLIQGTDGNFYGETSQGGNATCTGYPYGCGTVFKITPSGSLTTLHSFVDTDGSGPYGLAQGTNGKFYGVTQVGGGNGLGTLFEMTSEGTLTTLYSFCAQPNCTDGRGPSPMVQATDGKFYGTTFAGGTGGSQCSLQFGGCGTVFSLSVGLHPFVETLPVVGKVGTSVIILGNDLTGTTSVTFNGTPATFTVVTPTEIKTAVPTSATSGKVQVTTPHGTLTSNVVFRVK
jgi:uncharacterized repeat protein (TIGR03803 family)